MITRALALAGTLAAATASAGNGTPADSTILTVLAITPQRGMPAGGSYVEISGNGFVRGAGVRFGDVSATTVVVESSTLITAMTPAHIRGTADVIVTNPNGNTRTLEAGYRFAHDRVLPRRQVRRVFAPNRFVEPVLLTHAGDGSNRIFVVELAGRILVLPNREGAVATHFLDVTEAVNDVKPQSGLLSVAFHPMFGVNGRFFVFYSTGSYISRLSEFRVLDDGDMADPGSERVLLEIRQTSFHHNGNHLAFGSDGMLYVSQGSGGYNNDHKNSQDRTNLKGAILRIDVDTRTAGLEYGIPVDNPFAENNRGWREEIWAFGLRQTWRFSIDEKTGRLWGGDVGWGLWEEVNIVEKGANYGWATVEGRQCTSVRHAASAGCDREFFAPPIFQYGHSQGRGASIIGGYVYRGRRLGGLYGVYLYADFVDQSIWGLRYEDGKVVSNDFLATVPLPVSFGEDENGEVYIVGFGKGWIYTFEGLPDD